MSSSRSRALDETVVGRRSACDECRSRHVKCDSLTPTCTPCWLAGRRCRTSVEFKFRHDHNPSCLQSSTSNSRHRSSLVSPFGQDQSWVSVPSRLRFVIQTNHLEFDVDTPQTAEDGISIAPSEADLDENDPAHSTPAVYSLPPGPVSVQDHPTIATEPQSSLYLVDEISSHCAREAPTEDASTVETQCPQPDESQLFHSLDILDPFELDIPVAYPANALALDVRHFHAQDTDWRPQSRRTDYGYEFPTVSSPNSSLWPLQSIEEARLLRYFVTDLSMWFDYCDPNRHFANIVASTAAADSTLLNAILAVSAKHMSLKGSVRPHVSDEYQRRCLQTLIPALNNRDPVLSETLFAATVVLRFLDEMTEQTESTESRGHILGTHILVRAREDLAADSTLRAAALVVGLRQEIFLSFMTRVPVQPLADFCQIDRSLSPASDWMWALRMIAHTADVLNFCYSDESRTSASRKALDQYAETWFSCKPPSFIPIRYVAAEPSAQRYFPEVWLLNDCHVAGLQYYSICRILMLAYDPYIPSLGPDRHEAMRIVDEKIKAQIRLLCGIALSNERFMPAKLIAGMAIAMCGERFTDHEEQDQLFAILVDTEEHIAWPFLRFQEIIKRQWGRAT